MARERGQVDVSVLGATKAPPVTNVARTSTKSRETKLTSFVNVSRIDIVLYVCTNDFRPLSLKYSNLKMAPELTFTIF